MLGCLAPEVGFEPTTHWLTASCSTAELLRNESFCLGRMHPSSILSIRTNKNMQSKPATRKWLTFGLALCLVSLIFSPPTGPSAASGSAERGITRDDLTIQIAQKVQYSDDLSIAARDLTTGETFGLVETKGYDAASTMKIAILGVLYQQVQAGAVNLDEVLTIPSGEVQRYGTGSIQYESAPYRYSYRELAKRMMQQSDNTAAYILAKKVGHDEIAKFLTDQGMENSDFTNNTTTAADMLKLIENVYQGNVVNAELTAQMLAIMRDTQFEDRIPANLPGGVTVYHKTGDAFDGGSHDVGVVVKGNRAYAIAIFSRGLPADQVAAVSRLVYDYFIR